MLTLFRAMARQDRTRTRNRGRRPGGQHCLLVPDTETGPLGPAFSSFRGFDSPVLRQGKKIRMRLNVPAFKVAAAR
jgi:hypothetical protein